jgi:ubiquinone biosynthesis protein
MRVLGLQGFFALGWMPSNPFHKESRSEPERTRLAVEEMGRTFVKVGQILSTRTDLLPAEFTYELSKLQNSLKPFPIDVVHQAIQDELGKPVSSIFANFDPKLIGVASIGQAHAAALLDGSEVVVKVRKPGVIEQVAEDIEILRQLGASAAEHWHSLRQYDIVGIVEEIAETPIAEMDYQRERRNAEYFANFFNGDTLVHIPKIVSSRMGINLQGTHFIFRINACSTCGFHIHIANGSPKNKKRIEVGIVVRCSNYFFSRYCLLF